MQLWLLWFVQTAAATHNSFLVLAETLGMLIRSTPPAVVTSLDSPYSVDGARVPISARSMNKVRAVLLCRLLQLPIVHSQSLSSLVAVPDSAGGIHATASARACRCRQSSHGPPVLYEHGAVVVDIDVFAERRHRRDSAHGVRRPETVFQRINGTVAVGNGCVYPILATS